MLVNVIYDHGKIIFPDNVKLKDEKIPFVAEVPDDKLIVEEYIPKNPKLRDMIRNIKEILGDGYKYQSTGKTDKEIFMEAIEESGKYDL